MKIIIKKSELAALYDDLWRCAKNQAYYDAIKADVELCVRKHGISRYMGYSMESHIKEGIIPEYQTYFITSLKEKLDITMEMLP